MRIQCKVNGRPYSTDAVWAGESLLYVLRERFGLYGSKNACEQGECGSCSVYLDGTLVCACLVLAGQARGAEHVTVVGLAGDRAPPALPAPRPRPQRHPQPQSPRRQPLPLHRLREDPPRRPPRRLPDARRWGPGVRRGRGGARLRRTWRAQPIRRVAMIVIENCAIATVGPAGEIESGHVVVDG